jgi:hypothetical protein
MPDCTWNSRWSVHEKNSKDGAPVMAVSLAGTNGLLRPRITLADSSLANSTGDIREGVSTLGGVRMNQTFERSSCNLR